MLRRRCPRRSRCGQGANSKIWPSRSSRPASWFTRVCDARHWPVARAGPGCGCVTSGSASGCPRRSPRCSAPGCCRCWRTATSTGCTKASECGCRSGTPWSTAGTTTPPRSRHPHCWPGCCGTDARRAVKILYNALIRVSRDPAAADRAVLSDLDRQWRDIHLPAYRRLVADAQTEAATAAPHRLAQLVDQLGHAAGIYLWYLAIVGGSAWKMEACLTRFCRQHLADVLPDEQGGAQVLLRGLPGTQPVSTAHAVQSVDWYHPVAAELSTADIALPDGSARHARLAAAARDGRAGVPGGPRRPTAAAGRVRAAAAGQPALRGHPRGTVPRLHPRLAGPAHLRPASRRAPGRGRRDRRTADDVFFCTRDEVAARPADQAEPIDDDRAGAARAVAAPARPDRAVDTRSPGPADRRRDRPRRTGGPRDRARSARV